jgi:hypothetical protein
MDYNWQIPQYTTSLISAAIPPTQELVKVELGDHGPYSHIGKHL